MAIDPETGLEIGVDPETGLPMTVGTGNIVDPNEAGSDMVSEAGSAGDPDYDPAYISMLGDDDIPDAPDVPDDIEMPGMDMRPQSQEVSMGQSSSFRGITDAGKKQSDKFFGAAQTRADAKGAVLADQFQQDSLRVNDNIAKRKALAEELAGYDREHQDELLDIRRQQRDFNLKQQKLEELAYNKSMQNATAYISQYKQEMAGVRQMMLQTGNPLGGLTAVEGGALGAALFAQGFLGARGIQVNVAGQVDRWVEREMAAHQQKIQNATNTAESNLTLFNLARQGAMDDVMARQRMRGFVLDALKSSIYMEAARYKSQSALADAQMKAAKLDALALQNEMAMRDKLVKAQLDIYDKEILAAKYAADASLQAWSTAIDAKHKDRMAAVAEREKPKKEEKPAPSTKFYDPFNVKRDWLGKAITGGKATWMLDPNEEPGIRSKAAEEGGQAQRFFAEQGENLIKLRSLFDAAKGSMKGPEWARNRNSPEYREYMQVKNYLTENLQKDITGAAAPDAQAARIQGWLQADNFLEIGSNAKLIDNFIELQRNRYEKRMDNTPGIIRIPDDGTEGEYREKLTASPSLKNDFIAANASEADLTPAQKKAGEATGVDRYAPVGNSSGASKLYRMYIASGGNKASVDDDRPTSVNTVGERVGAQLGGTVVNADKQVDTLVDMVIHPDKYMDRWNGEDPEAFVQDAYKQLEQVKTDYAKYAATMVRSQPAAVKILME